MRLWRAGVADAALRRPSAWRELTTFHVLRATHTRRTSQRDVPTHCSKRFGVLTVCRLDRLHGLHRLVKGVVELAILRDPAPQDRFEIGQIADVDDLVNALHKARSSRHWWQNDDSRERRNVRGVAAPGRLIRSCRMGLVCKVRAFEVLVDDDDVVAVGAQLEENVFLEQAEMDLVGHVDQLRERPPFDIVDDQCTRARYCRPRRRKRYQVRFARRLAKGVGRQVEAEAGIEVVVDAARFLDQVDSAGDSCLCGKQRGGAFPR